jgi:large-conductance mechanosensitive channel
MNFDQFIRKFLKFLNIALWIFIAIVLILWYSDNKEKFFPQRKVPNIPNPINPFR